VSTAKSTCRRSPTTSNAEPSLMRTFSSFGVWSIAVLADELEAAVGIVELETRMRPRGSGTPSPTALSLRTRDRRRPSVHRQAEVALGHRRAQP
jgi:hypothetical protein